MSALADLTRRPECVYADDAVVLLCGEWQQFVEVLPTVDAVISDPPYSERTHAGHDAATRSDDSFDASRGSRRQTKAINYAAWTDAEMHEAGGAWSFLARGWVVVLTDDVSVPTWKGAYESARRMNFASVPIVEVGSRVRLTGDGPSSWSCYAVVSRPRTREYSRWGTLRGAYVYTGRGERVVMGGKRVDTMRDLVRDYSRPGDLILDPCAGGGTTAVAARLEGRRCILIERDHDTVELCAKRLHPYRDHRASDAQRSLFA